MILNFLAGLILACKRKNMPAKKKMIDRIKEYEELDRLEREEDCFSGCSEGFFRKQPMG